MKIELFVDDEAEPRAAFAPPAPFDLDTTALADGPHVLRIRAIEDDGTTGVQEVPFTVRNGPGIAVVGLADNEVVQGRIPLLVNAYASRVGDTFEPSRAETPAPVPTWAWVLCLLVGAWAMFYAISEYREYAASLAASAPSSAQVEPARTAPEAGSAPAPAQQAFGAQLYGNYCSSCHQLGGTGLPGVFPPLKGDPVVTAEDPSEHIRIILNGLQGKPINGVTYASPMPAFGNQLDDKQIAALINHERISWGNAAPIVTPEAVAAQR